MKYSFGNQQVVRETKKSTVRWIRVGAIAFLLLFGLLGAFFILDPLTPEDTVMGFVSLGMAVVMFIVLLVFSNKICSEVIVYDEGVVVKKGGKEHQFHFNEIAGLRDFPSASTLIAAGAYGVAGAIITGVVSAAAGNTDDAKRRKHRIRNISIVPNDIYLGEVSVANTGGNELSLNYTEWLIKQKSITKENINSLTLSFGDHLELNQGTLIYKHRRGDISLALTDITDLNVGEHHNLSFFGLNDKGEIKCLIDIRIVQIMNIDLLFSIYNMMAV